jgi:Flp pilus assembly protein TadG
MAMLLHPLASNGRGPLLRGNARRGVEAVELAVIAPFLALIFVITVDFARVFYYQQTINDCARNGALYGANLRSYQENGWVSPYSDANSVALSDGACLNPPLNSSQVTVKYGTGSDGNPNVTVTINYAFTTVTQFPGFGTTVNLTATCKMRVAPYP